MGLIHGTAKHELKLNIWHAPMVTLSPIIVGSTFPARLVLATWTRELS